MDRIEALETKIDEFKIDFIVWKFRGVCKWASSNLWFKIDFIVWKCERAKVCIIDYLKFKIDFIVWKCRFFSRCCSSNFV